MNFISLDTAAFRKNTLDSVWLWGDRVSSTDFIKRYSGDYSNTNFSKIILDTSKTSYSSIGCHPSPLIEEAIRQEHGDAFDCKEVTIRDTLDFLVNALEFTFLKTTKGYRLFGLKNYSYNQSRVDRIVDTTRPER